MLPTLLLLLQSAGDPALVYDGRARQLHVKPPRLEASVVIDGNLDEPVWRQAALLTGFSQYRPVDGRPAADSTQVLVWYAADAIYFGVRAFESHGPVVRATLADRDNIDRDDRIHILLDTYFDHRRALLFAVNPLGVQQDGIWSDGVDAGAAGGPSAGGRFDATIDLNPDFVYQSRGHLTPWGYEVEIRIPFKSLRYQSADPQTWGLQVERITQHTGYEDTWTPAVRANASFLIQSGELDGLTDLHRGLVMDATPEFTTRVEGRPTAGPYLYTGKPELGGNLRWGLTQNLNLAGTANPDFSQVEADVGQVTVNQRFALFYPEKRPFFLEGLEQFDTPNRLIYTRRIQQPSAGVKLTGKEGGMNVAYLAAVDDQAASTTGATPVFNLLRLRRDLGASSTLGLAYTDRIDGGTYNRVLGADGRVVWRRLWFSAVQVVGSWTLDGAGARAGKLWSVTFADRTGRSYGNHYELQGVSPDFQAASGFVNRTNFVLARIANRFTWYGKPGAPVEQLSTYVILNPLWRYDDFMKQRSAIEGGYQLLSTANLRGGWGATAQIQQAIQRFDSASYAGYAVDRTMDTIPLATPHSLYNLWGANVGLNTPNRVLTLGLNVGFGDAVLFAEGARGRQFALGANAAWRPTASLRVEALWTHQRLTRSRDGSHFSTANIPRLKVEYQLTRSIFFRYVGQYFAQDQVALRDPRTGQPLLRGGVSAGATSVNDFRNDVLFSYKPTPGTVFFFGYGASLDEPDAFRFRGMKRTGDGFFLKASYLYRM
jgi:Domain of unknown function (DUF5916)